MAISDALYVVEDWISEHYFTSDDASKTFTARTKALMQEWRSTGEDDPDWRSPRERFTSARTGLVSRLLELQADAAALPETAHPDQRRELLRERSVALADELRTILGYTDDTGDEAAPGRWDVTTTGPLRRFATRGVDEAPLAMLDALAADDVQDVLAKQAGHLPADVVLAEGTEDEQRLTSVPQVLSALAISKDAPEFLLVLAGRFAVLTSAQLWPQGRYLVADLQTIAERNDLKRGGEVERMLAALSADSLAPDANSQIWWAATVQESIDNAVGVSEDLRDGVRDSIEIIANEVTRRREAQGLDPLPQDQAQPLALQSLRYLYRILFLLYAEASPELGVLPTGAPEYQAGYSVDRLRDLTQREVPLDAAHGTYLFSSLQILFDLINKGHRPTDAQADGPAEHGSGALVFENLDADLFRKDRTALIDEVKLGNQALQAVLENLLLSRVKKGKNRGFISYVALGINQLGAVYESLMSYTGSFADQDLVEVAKGGDPKDGSWVVPEDVIDESMTQHLVMVEDETGRKVPRTYRHGEFVFRLSGRARQQSASYYSPEVITSFTVSQGLAELLDPVITDETDLPDGTIVFDDEDFDHEPIRRRRTTAAEILNMSICEPALGSGAFAIEAVRQLAAEYLTRRQDELDQRIDPEQYAEELQRVKAYIALHNVYGVDLNSTAVELAEVSLWLDTMAPGLKAPWFGLRLRAGNSLIGARHAVYSAETLKDARLKAITETAPENLPVTTVHDQPDADGTRAGVAGKIFHFLLPGEGWLAAASDAEIKKLAPDAAKALRERAKGWAGKLTKPQIAQLEKLSQRVEELWGLALRRIRAAEEQSRRAIPVWGAETTEGGEVTRKQIEETLADANSAYQRLRLVMDAWCALWFWPVLPEDDVAPPTFYQWLETVQKILGTSLEVVKHATRSKGPGAGQLAIGSAQDWEELDAVEMMFGVGGAANIDQLIKDTKWLKRCIEIAKEQRFFHWELDFAAAFDRGGFDLQVGNPPWVYPGEPVTAIAIELDPTAYLSSAPKAKAYDVISTRAEWLHLALRSRSRGAAESRFLSASSQYPDADGKVADLYHAFIALGWMNVQRGGIVALVHPPGHLSAKGLSGLKRGSYLRLRRLWSFRNEKKLFKEIGNTRPFAVNIYGEPYFDGFLFAYPLFDPATALQSLAHDGSGPIPPAVDAEGVRNVAPHRQRVHLVTPDDLRAVQSATGGAEGAQAPLAPRLPSSMDSVIFEFLSAIEGAARVEGLGPQYSGGLSEEAAIVSGELVRRWGVVNRWQNVVLQGPNVDILNPAFQDRGRSMGSHRDYVAVDLQEPLRERVPATEYKRAGGASTPPGLNGDVHRGDIGALQGGYSLAWRRRVDPTTSRTLQAAILPPGATHVSYMHSIHSLGALDLVDVAGSASSLIADFLIRSLAVGNVYGELFDRLPVPSEGHALIGEFRARVVALNCIHPDFADLWRSVTSSFTQEVEWATNGSEGADGMLPRVDSAWSPDSPLLGAEQRRRAQVEIDSLMALMLGIDIDLLVAMYRQHFGTLWKYDHGLGANALVYDRGGNVVPSAIRAKWMKGKCSDADMSPEDRTAVHPSATGTGRTIVYEQPFRILDREADMRQAYAEFTRRMKENRS
ncbi:DNA methyltransferase [Brachybacterium muris]|uniref:site-specific DNA-methyltransferase (adenine-specific) n=1 Tax=Brachybacterium muris UCD-AY4 TaxID=1249481 RepID=A0A022KY54_9MICO|nr:DNA methyltransferase [Brachybacterium muris]EYT49855.1 restriction enzyme [Brachybacterium muris UCD-AY4]